MGTRVALLCLGMLTAAIPAATAQTGGGARLASGRAAPSFGSFSSDVPSVDASHAVCGMRCLLDHPDRFPLPAPKPVVGDSLLGEVCVGTQLDFLVAGDLYLHTGTCRFVGDHCYLFVEDAQWDTNGGSIFQSDVDTLGKLFERSTPADPHRGMYALLTDTFGPPPDVDGYSRIFVFIVELADARMVGFFDPRVATWPDPRFRRDTLYLDAGMLRRRPYLARGTLAHEFQHLIHFGADPDEESWVNEGLSGYAEALTGFPETDTSMVDAFLRQPDFDLTVWPVQAGAANYGATYLFAAFYPNLYIFGAAGSRTNRPAAGALGTTAASRRSTTNWAA